MSNKFKVGNTILSDYKKAKELARKTSQAIYLADDEPRRIGLIKTDIQFDIDDEIFVDDESCIIDEED